MSLYAFAYAAVIVLLYELCEWTIAMVFIAAGIVIGGLIHRFARSTALCVLCAEVALIVLCLCDSRDNPSALLLIGRNNPLLVWHAFGFLPTIASILAGYWGAGFLATVWKDAHVIDRTANGVATRLAAAPNGPSSRTATAISYWIAG